MSGYTFELWDDAGNRGSITVPVPARWYYRWPLRFAAWLWGKVADATIERGAEREAE